MSEFSFDDNGTFDIFWDAYPRKVGKFKALKSWERLKPSYTLTDMIMTALEFHKKQEGWNKEGGKFIPHPATWLNQRRWEDEIKLDPQQKIISEAEKARIAQKLINRDAELYRLAERDLEARRSGKL